jgi:hypothetical protein
MSKSRSQLFGLLQKPPAQLTASSSKIGTARRSVPDKVYTATKKKSQKKRFERIKALSEGCVRWHVQHCHAGEVRLLEGSGSHWTRIKREITSHNTHEQASQ